MIINPIIKPAKDDLLRSFLNEPISTFVNDSLLYFDDSVIAGELMLAYMFTRMRSCHCMTGLSLRNGRKAGFNGRLPDVLPER